MEQQPYNFRINIGGKTQIIGLNRTFVVDNMRFIFIGIKDKGDTIPNINCAYAINKTNKSLEELRELSNRGNIHKFIGPIVIHRKSYKPLLDNKNEIIDPSKEFDNNPLSDKLLDLVINPDDDEIMVIMKSLLIRDKITSSQFRKIYLRGEEKESPEAINIRMHNDKYRLETGESLSWKKASSLIKKMGYKYVLSIFSGEDDVIDNNSDFKSIVSKINPEDFDDKPLRLTIQPNDDEIMVIVKTLLIRDKITVSKFKEIYFRGEDPTNEKTITRMNNDKHRLETGKSLSWKKASSLIKKMGYKYTLEIHDAKTSEKEIF